jgi:Ran GTPase-activating protein (RanGAP) involved in mRNA processing and transport
MSEGKENLPWAQPSYKPSSILDLSRHDLGPVGTVSLAEYLRRDKNIETLDMTQTNVVGDKYDDKGVEAIAVALSVNSTLKHLKMFGNKLRDESVDHFVKILLGNDTLKTLNVGYNDFSAKGVIEIADAVASNESLEELTVGAGTIRVQEVRGKVTATSSSKKNKKKNVKKDSMKKLNLRNKSLGPLSALVVSRLLKENTVVEVIDVSHNSLRKEGTRAICNTLSVLPSLTQVNISSNEIFPDGCESMATLVAGSKELKVLKLAENNLTNWGRDCGPMEHVIDNALQRGILRVLHLQGNVLRETGAAVISRFIQESKSLEEIDVSRAQLGAEGAIEISKALSASNKDSNFKILKIAENNIGGRGATPIIEAICTSNHQLVEINFAKNNIPENAVLGWVDILLYHRDEWNLEEIELQGNRVATSLQDDFINLPKRTANRYGIMSGIARVAALKEFRKNYELFKDGKRNNVESGNDAVSANDDKMDVDVEEQKGGEQDSENDADKIVDGIKDMDISPRVEYERDERTRLAVMSYVNSTNTESSNSPQTNSTFVDGEDRDTFSSSDDEDLDPATLAAMRNAYAGISGAEVDMKSNASKTTIGGSKTIASLNVANNDILGTNSNNNTNVGQNTNVIQTFGQGAGTGRSQIQGLSPRRVNSNSGSNASTNNTNGAVSSDNNIRPKAPTSIKAPPKGPKPSNVSQGRRALLKVNNNNDDDSNSLNAPPQPMRKMKKKKTAAELKKMREEQEEEYKRQEAVAKSYELYKQQKAARAAKKK